MSCDRNPVIGPLLILGGKNHRHYQDILKIWEKITTRRFLSLMVLVLSLNHGLWLILFIHLFLSFFLSVLSLLLFNSLRFAHSIKKRVRE